MFVDDVPDARVSGGTAMKKSFECFIEHGCLRLSIGQICFLISLKHPVPG